MRHHLLQRTQQTTLWPRWQGTRIIAVIILALVAALYVAQPAGVALASSQGGSGGGGGVTLTISSPSPPQGPAGTTVVVTGNGWPTGATVTLATGSAAGNCQSPTAVSGATGQANGDGFVQISFTWPSLAPGTYPVCGSVQGESSSPKQSANSFTELSQSSPSISLPGSVASGATVNLTGSNWLPAGIQVEILDGPQGGTGCSTHLVTLTSKNNGALSGSFTAPNVTSTTTFAITAVSPPNTCNSAAAPSLHATTTLTVTAGSGTGATSTPIHKPGGATPTPTKTGGSGNSSPPPAPGPCPPLPKSFCSSGGGSVCLLCLIPLILLLLLIILVALFARRRNEEVVVSEEDISKQTDPDSVTPMGNYRYTRTMRETTQVVDRKTGAVRRSRVRIFDEFTDAQGNVHRRPHQ